MSKREEFKIALKEAMKSKETVAVSTIRLIMAALKDRDVAARGKGDMEGVSEEDILAMLQTMLKQRGESIAIYKKSGRDDLVAQEEAEVKVIKTFLPEPLEGDALDAAIAGVIEKTGAQSIKDMGKVMGVLKTDYAGRLDMAQVGALVRAKLG